MKYLFVNIGIRQGEFFYDSLSIHKVEDDVIPDEFGRKYAQDFYNNNAPEVDCENGEYWHDSLVTYLNECQEISLEESKVLQRFL